MSCVIGAKSFSVSYGSFGYMLGLTTCPVPTMSIVYPSPGAFAATEAERRGQVVFFYGSTIETLALLEKALFKAFPKLKIGGMESPPFRELTAEEDQAYVDQINAAGTAVVFVGLGCPKQEKWMAAHKGRIHAVMVGVGAAFDYHAGTIQRAPMWMQRNGLEWLHRLASEPKRLWKRYLVTNTVFVVQTSRALVSSAFAKTK